MAIEKSLTIRDYLGASRANGRLARPAARRLASFQEMLKNAQLRPADAATAGKKISDYVRAPFLMARSRRLERLMGALQNSSDGLGRSAGERNAGVSAGLRPNESAPALDPANDRSPAASAQNDPAGVKGRSRDGERVERSIRQAAAKYDLPPELIRSVIQAESNFQVNAVSPAGAKGLMQLMPETARELGVADVFDIQQNIDGGARYLRKMLDRFGGDLKRALAAYNAGPGAVEQFNGEVPYAETRRYVKRVLRSAGMG